MRYIRAVTVVMLSLAGAACQVTEKKVDGETKSVEVSPAPVQVGTDTQTVTVPTVDVQGDSASQ